MYEKLGRMVGRSYEETISLLVKALKNAEVAFSYWKTFFTLSLNATNTVAVFLVICLLYTVYDTFSVHCICFWLLISYVDDIRIHKLIIMCHPAHHDYMLILTNLAFCKEDFKACYKWFWIILLTLCCYGGCTSQSNAFMTHWWQYYLPIHMCLTAVRQVTLG